MQSGPFAGIFTFDRKRDLLNSIQDSLKPIEATNNTVMFTNYPVGYLQTKLKPHTRVLLTGGLEKPGVIDSHKQFFEKYGPPDVYFELIGIPYYPEYDDSVSKDVRWPAMLELRKVLSAFAHYRLAKQDRYFLIWERER